MAVVLAMAVPGAGHMYADKLLSGVIYLLIMVSLVILELVMVVSAFRDYVSGGTAGFLFIAVGLAILVIYVWQVYDAYHSAKRYNADRGLVEFF